jgi:hypothetical protein
MGFLAKIDAAGDRLLFSTLVGGNAMVPFAVHLSGYSLGWGWDVWHPTTRVK